MCPNLGTPIERMFARVVGFVILSLIAHIVKAQIKSEIQASKHETKHKMIIRPNIPVYNFVLFQLQFGYTLE